MARKPAFLGLRGRRARAKARAGISLRDIGISRPTFSRYYVAVSTLVKIIGDPRSIEDLDETIAEWIEQKFHQGATLNLVADALSGIHYFMPFTKKRLPHSWKLFGIWRRHEIPSRAPPLPEDLLWAMVGRCLELGDFSMASLLGLGFHCFLRTGEILSIRPCDLLLGPKNGIVTLPRSKGGVRHNTHESVTIVDPVLLLVLHEMLALKAAQRLTKVSIWTGSGSSFRNAFYKLCDYFQVRHLDFRCYSLRRGGATAFFASCGLMEQTLLRGRWQSVSVARLYLCEALSLLPKLVASPATAALIRQHRAFFSTP